MFYFNTVILALSVYSLEMIIYIDRNCKLAVISNGNNNNNTNNRPHDQV